MAGFIVKGAIAGRDVSVFWSAGTIDGDGLAVARVLELVDANETIAGTPTGPFFNAALVPASVALATILQAFDDVAGVSGEIPTVAGVEIPKGATP